MQTRDEVIAAVKAAAEELGRVPTLQWLLRYDKVREYAIKKHFGRFRKCLEAAGMEPHRHGYEVGDRELLSDLARVVRLLGRIPSMTDYVTHGGYSQQPMRRRFGSWINLPAALVDFARKEGLQEEWNDVLDIAARHMHAATEGGCTSAESSGAPYQPRILKDEPFFGPPMVKNYLLLLQPTNEQEVIFLFGGMAVKLGFAVLKIRTEYPDGMALREVAPGKWQLVKIEFEQESRNFLRHKHDPAGAHLIVCWKHNWPDCPLEVIELSSLVTKLLEGE
jgi:Homing endonuclease associated repeat